MYAMAETQLTVYDFVHPLGRAERGQPLGKSWRRPRTGVGLERQYAAHFHKAGAQALPVRMAFGSLVIRAALGLSDRQTVELIREDPYLQYFIGLAAFQHEAPFSAHSRRPSASGYRSGR